MNSSIDGTLPPPAGSQLRERGERLDPSAQSRRDRAEFLIATGRVLLVLFSIVALWLDPLQDGHRDALRVLVAFSIYALGIFVVILRRGVISHRDRLVMHAGDLLLITLVFFATRSSTSFFFLFFVFVLLSGTLRFGSRGTILTAAAAVSMYVVASLAVERIRGEEFEVNRFVIRTSHLVVLASLLVYLARHDERVQQDIARLAEWKFESADVMRSVLQSTLSQVSTTMRSSRNVLVIAPDEEPYLEIAIEREGALRLDRVSPERYPQLVDQRFSDDDFICDDSMEASPRVTTAVEAGPRTGSGPVLAEEFARDFGGGALVSVNLDGRTFTGRLFCFAADEWTVDDLLLGRIVGTLVRSRLDEFYLTRAAEARAVERDRLRLARDLHDGLLQSLTAVRLQLQSLDAHLNDPQKIRTTLDNVRHLIEEDHTELRRFVQDLRPELSGGSMRLGERLSELGARIRRQWGVELSIDIDRATPLLGDELLHDIYSIVHEAVANTARHASPSRIGVSVKSDEHSSTILVSNDGRGFAFTGRYTLEDLQTLECGPVSLKERIALLHGEMVLDSRDDGTDLLIRLPRARSGKA